MGDRLGIPGAVGFLDSAPACPLLLLVTVTTTAGPSGTRDPGPGQSSPTHTPHSGESTPPRPPRIGRGLYCPSPLAPGALRVGTATPHHTAPPCRAGWLASWQRFGGESPSPFAPSPGWPPTPTRPTHPDPTPHLAPTLHRQGGGWTRLLHPSPSPTPSPWEESPKNPATTCLSSLPREV